MTTIVFALMVEVNDSYLGSYDEVLELFIDRAIAEHAMEGLIGKPVKERRPYDFSSYTGPVWYAHDFSIQEMTLR